MLLLNRFQIFLILCAGLLSACVTTSEKPANNPAAYAMPDRYSAATVDSILKAGGNAVDAAIAASFVLAVTLPEAGNIGGGGFMLAHMEGSNYFLDYREKAPLQASRDMYLDDNGDVIDKASLIGIRAAGVPGSVDGMWQAHQKFASMSWQRLLAPAINYAENGFEVHAKQAAAIPELLDWFGDKVNFAEHFGDIAKGGVFKQPELAQVLKRIASDGPDDFYQGKTAQLMLAQSQRDNGLFSAEDLKNYESVWRKPLVAAWQDHQVITAPPPSSGGFALIQLLKMKELLAEQFDGQEVNSSKYVHLVAEIEKRVFADRAEYFGDPDFVDVPIDELISDEYIGKRASSISASSISTVEQVPPGLESADTTHYSIVDKWGNAVANTTTINWNYGSGVVVEGAGFLLNNEMDDFSTKPGVANVYGVVGGTANEIQPGKRMLSSMTPTILIKDSMPQIIVGTRGGSTIFTSVFQAIVNVVDYGMSTDRAVSLSRFHHQLLPADLITMSRAYPLDESTQAELQDMGYRVEPHPWEFGDLQMIKVNRYEANPASDPRGIGVSGVVE